MKKLMLLLVSFLVLGSITACASEEPEGELVIGVPPMNGDFVVGFSSSAYDRFVTDMIWGHGTYTTNPAGEFLLDETVVDEEVITENDDGSKTYTYTLSKDLKWSDGEEITAKDYVFDILLRNSQEWADVEGNNQTNYELVGWDEYAAGETDSFEGVELLDDNKFSVTIKADELPYFYEIVYASAGPSPMHVWAPGVEIAEDGKSLDFGGDAEFSDLAAVATNISEKERFEPSVTSGPFAFESYAQETVTLKNNEHYAGDYRGETAKLDSVIIKRINEKLDVDYVINGEVDLVNGVIEGKKIEKALENDDKVSFVKYPRNGYGNITFHTDFGSTADPKVRQALAYSIDRSMFVSQILGGFGTTVDGMYGLSQWMYEEKKADLEEELNHFTLNAEKANELLDESTYKFEEDGSTPYDSSKASADYIRHNSDGEELVINHAGSENNEISELIATEFPKNLAQVGANFTIEYLDFNALLQYLQQPASQEGAYGERKFNTFNLATSFTEVFDPKTSLHSEYFGTPYNNTQTDDDKMDELIENMRRHDGEDREGFLDDWFEFQTYFNEYLPLIPLYSNEYYDIHTNRVQNLETTPTYTIGRAIIDVTVE